LTRKYTAYGVLSVARTSADPHSGQRGSGGRVGDRLSCGGAVPIGIDGLDRESISPRERFSFASKPLSTSSRMQFLVDMSGSMNVGPKIAMARQAYDSLLLQLRDGQDELAVFTFDSALHERQPFTNNVAGL